MKIKKLLIILPLISLFCSCEKNSNEQTSSVIDEVTAQNENGKRFTFNTKDDPLDVFKILDANFNNFDSNRCKFTLNSFETWGYMSADAIYTDTYMYTDTISGLYRAQYEYYAEYDGENRIVNRGGITYINNKPAYGANSISGNMTTLENGAVLPPDSDYVFVNRPLKYYQISNLWSTSIKPFECQYTIDDVTETYKLCDNFDELNISFELSQDYVVVKVKFPYGYNYNAGFTYPKPNIKYAWYMGTLNSKGSSYFNKKYYLNISTGKIDKIVANFKGLDHIFYYMTNCQHNFVLERYENDVSGKVNALKEKLNELAVY